MISIFFLAPWNFRNMFFNCPLDIPTHLCTMVMESKHVKILPKNVPSPEILCWIMIYRRLINLIGNFKDTLNNSLFFFRIIFNYTPTHIRCTSAFHIG